jgi:hypothetical protein
MKKQSRNLYVNRIEVNDAVSVVDIFEFLQKIWKIHKGIKSGWGIGWKYQKQPEEMWNGSEDSWGIVQGSRMTDLLRKSSKHSRRFPPHSLPYKRKPSQATDKTTKFNIKLQLIIARVKDENRISKEMLYDKPRWKVKWNICEYNSRVQYLRPSVPFHIHTSLYPVYVSVTKCLYISERKALRLFFDRILKHLWIIFIYFFPCVLLLLFLSRELCAMIYGWK